MTEQWVRSAKGHYVCSRLGLAIERSPDDGWWYVSPADEDGLPSGDALWWATTLRDAKQIAADASRREGKP